jgi:hypothetical protein
LCTGNGKQVSASITLRPPPTLNDKKASVHGGNVKKTSNTECVGYSGSPAYLQEIPAHRKITCPSSSMGLPIVSPNKGIKFLNRYINLAALNSI